MKQKQAAQKRKKGEADAPRPTSVPPGQRGIPRRQEQQNQKEPPPRPVDTDEEEQEEQPEHRRRA